MKIYNYFLVTAVIIMVAFLADSSFRPHYEIYYADPIKLFTWYPALAMVLLWRVCRLTDQFLYSAKLRYAHVITSCLALGWIYISPFLHFPSKNGMAGAARRYFDYEGLSMVEMVSYFSKPVRISVMVFLFAQILFILNIALGIGERPTIKT